MSRYLPGESRAHVPWRPCEPSRQAQARRQSGERSSPDPGDSRAADRAYAGLIPRGPCRGAVMLYAPLRTLICIDSAGRIRLAVDQRGMLYVSFADPVITELGFERITSGRYARPRCRT